MRILIHAPAAKMGGAGNYIRTLARELAQVEGHQFFFLVPPSQAEAIQGLAPHIHLLANDLAGKSPFSRFCFDQLKLPLFLRKKRINVLFSAANFATFFCPCRQLLLMRNSLYFSTLYREKILPHKAFCTRFAESLRRFLARRSAMAADVVITPSQSMLCELQAAVPVRAAQVSHYGVDRRRFRPSPRPFAPQGVVRLVFTSLYAEHKNLATLLRALPQMDAKCRLITTCDPGWEQIHNPIRASDQALALHLQRLGLLELTGVLSGPALDQLYAQADIFVYPSVIESFGHPLLEAMASGLPVVAADVPVNRELCGDSALYFSPFDEADCARQVGAVIHDAAIRQSLVQHGLERVEHFQWSSHARVLMHHFSSTPDILAEPVESHA